MKENMPTILITGANRGIGLELVKQYCHDNWQVLACCRSPDNAIELNTLAKEFYQLRIFHLDLNHLSELEAFANHLGSKTIDVLFNNAGVYGPQKTSLNNFTKETCQQWLEVFQTNTVAPFYLSKLLVNNVSNSQLKIIVNMSSAMASISKNDIGHAYIYRSSKCALNAVTKNLAIDLKEKNITVIALHPGWVKTDMGGPNADIATTTSVNGIRKVIACLTLNDSGRFFSYDGSQVPW